MSGTTVMASPDHGAKRAIGLFPAVGVLRFKTAQRFAAGEIKVLVSTTVIEGMGSDMAILSKMAVHRTG